MADATAELAGVCTGPGPCDVHPTGHGDNWVTRAGGLPPYLRAIVHALMRKGMAKARAIPVGINRLKYWRDGKGGVSAGTKARAAKALAEWDALRAKAHASALGDAVTASGATMALEFSDIWIAEFANMGTKDGPTHAGMALKAADTGRVLMLQRALEDPNDPAAGKWEFPGGGHEDGDLSSLHTAIREWQEETGQPFPSGGLVSGTWTAPNGIYQGHVVVVPDESVISPTEGRIHLNPDDPDGDNSEAVAWWDPDDAAANPALREECQSTPWDLIKMAGTNLVPAQEGDDGNQVAIVASGRHRYLTIADACRAAGLSGEVPEHSPLSPTFAQIEQEQEALGMVYHSEFGWVPTTHFAAPDALREKRDREAKRADRSGRQEPAVTNPTAPPTADAPVAASGRVSLRPWTRRALTAAGGRPLDYDEAELAALIASALTEVPAEQVPDGLGGGVPFRIPLLIPTDIKTGDRRRFKAGGLSSREFPMPLYFQKETDDGHKKSVIVARIDKAEKVKGGIGNAIGEFDTGPDAQEALRLIRGLFLRGVSADVDNIDAEMANASDDGKPEVTFNKGRLTAGTLVGKPAFAECQIELPGDPEWEQNMQRFKSEYGDDVKPLVAAGGPMFPPGEWFSNPQLTEPTHLTITDEGRVFGHIASWEIDHIGMPFQRAPRNRSGYRYFASGKLKTAEGDLVPVGQLTLQGGHADLSLAADAAKKHYDDTDSAVADVAIGEDQFGIWVAGAARPDMTDLQMRQFQAADVSGDWRPVGNNLELVAALCVNCAGFPIPQPTARVASGGVVTALVAAGMPALMRATGRLADRPEALAARVSSLETAHRQTVAMELREQMAASRAVEAERLRTLVASGSPPDLIDPAAAAAEARAETLGLADSGEFVEEGDEFADGNRFIRKRGNKFVILKKGTGKVISSHDTKEKAEGAFRAMMKGKYGG